MARGVVVVPPQHHLGGVGADDGAGAHDERPERVLRRVDHELVREDGVQYLHPPHLIVKGLRVAVLAIEIG